ncbi:MAG: cupin domain-containing protein [Phenylobacterium sp.]|uniref:cupin domain-containing protein n=1 Tax=Phenylobacterium sp. TaxID=1871053 RepID=UPI001A42A389|nr:cupin domain-containing protein [Phenylobacterium sp.]MBL8769972.1 cupin domain-containing protein [Phenylobacterium sp.]
MRRVLILLLAAAAFPAAAQTPPAPGKPVTIDATLTGQPIRAAPGDLRVSISQVELPAGGRLAAHKHPYARVVNVLAGRLRVINLDTGDVREVAAGDWVVDAVEQWHEASVVGPEPVRLITIDLAPPGAPVTIQRTP